MSTTFVWNEKKNAKNILKHGVDFNDAKQVFYGAYDLEVDHEHSTEDEERYHAIGHVLSLGVIRVVFAERIENVIEIISARKI